MSVAIINSLTVTEFIDDKEAFKKCINEQFMLLDANGDGVLSRSELWKGFDGLLMLRTEARTEEEITTLCDTVFDKFDADNSGTIGRNEFSSEMKEIMMAVAHGIGDTPVQVALEGNSMLKRAVEHEMAKRL